MSRVRLSLVRSYLDNCTIGTLYYQGDKIMYTVEKPWLSNVPFHSCIPHGEYVIHPHDSKNHPNSFYLENKNLGVSLMGDTPRTGILIHVGNFPKDVVGCIAPGLFLHPTNWGVSSSGDAMIKLNLILNRKEKDRDWKILIK